MKYIKAFDEIGDEISVGDYVILDISKLNMPKQITQYVNNNIGIVVFKGYWSINVKYDDIIPEIDKKTISVNYDSIVNFDKSKEELIFRENIKKYNL